jgi:hypothetical protein
MFREVEEYNCLTFMEAFVGCLSLFSLYWCYENRYQRVSINNRREERRDSSNKEGRTEG